MKIYITFEVESEAQTDLKGLKVFSEIESAVKLSSDKAKDQSFKVVLVSESMPQEIK